MRWPGVFLVAALAACGDDFAGPFDALPIDGEFDVGVDAPAHVARDRHGIAHIVADSISDAAFVQGYVMAHDRLPQMDLLRRYATGRLAELYGEADPSVIDTDLVMRLHRIEHFAELSLQALDPNADRELLEALDGFARGVTQYISDVRDDTWRIDPAIDAHVNLANLPDWTPRDSLAIARLWALSYAWSAPYEIAATELYQKLRKSYDNEPQDQGATDRRGISRDVVRFAPIAAQPAQLAPTMPSVATLAATRPVVPDELFAAARAWFAHDIADGPFGALGPSALGRDVAGSTSVAIAPGAVGNDAALLAGDHQLPLGNPALYYPTHVIAGDQLDVLGLTVPGIPGVVVGSNGALAWSPALSGHDVNDVFLERIAPCAGGAECQRIEQIAIGTRDGISRTETVIYELGPRGPILPELDRARHTLVPRTQLTALSIAFTGYQPSFELRALWKLARATTVAEGFTALSDASFGPSWTLIDAAQQIGWTAVAELPVRATAYTWDPFIAQDALSPFFVLPGDGTVDWRTPPNERMGPSATSSPTGYIVTADDDPAGATFDERPLNQQPYLGITYAAGLRAARIAQLLDQRKTAGQPLGLGELAAILRDTHSTVGEKLTPVLLTFLAQLDNPPPIPPDVGPYVAALSADDRQQLSRARELLANWRFETPAANAPGDTSSAATALFNTWMHLFLRGVLDDELAAIGLDLTQLTRALGEDALSRIVMAFLIDRRSFVTSPATQQPILCDNYNVGGLNSCTRLILQSLVDAMKHLASPQAFGTDDIAQWQWGQLHRLRLAPGFADPAFALPRDSAGAPRPGDNFAVDRSDPGWLDADFAIERAAAFRMLAEARTGEPIRTRWALPGGAIFDPQSPHYQDLLERSYLTDQPFEAPSAIDDIVAAGESRWVFH